MRPSCCICQEAFLSVDSVCATMCGHLFHFEGCLKGWLDTNNTCPSCRERVTVSTLIPRIFFTESEDPLDDVTKLKRSDSAKSDRIKSLEAECQKQKDWISALRSTNKDLQKVYNAENSKNQTLRKEMANYKRAAAQSEAAQQEVNRLQEKLAKLKALDILRQGLCSSEIDELVGEKPRDLAERIVFLTKTIALKRKDFAQLQLTFDAQAKAYRDTKKQLQSIREEHDVLKTRFAQSEEDLARLDAQNVNLKEKLNTAVSDATLSSRLVDSPAPVTCPAKRPRLHQFSDSSDPQQSSFDGNNKEQRLPVLKKCRTLSENRLLNRVSTVSKPPEGPKLSSFNIMKRTCGSGLLQENSAIRTGFNGLGGHEKHIITKSFKPVKRKANNKRLAATATRPPLPQLDL